MIDETGEVERIAALARLDLSPEEVAAFAVDFRGILAELQRLDEVDTAGVAPLHHPVPLGDVLRDPATPPAPPLPRGSWLPLAADSVDGHVRVPPMRTPDLHTSPTRTHDEQP